MNIPICDIVSVTVNGTNLHSCVGESVQEVIEPLASVNHDLNIIDYAIVSESTEGYVINTLALNTSEYTTVTYDIEINFSLLNPGMGFFNRTVEAILRVVDDSGLIISQLSGSYSGIDTSQPDREGKELSAIIQSLFVTREVVFTGTLQVTAPAVNHTFNLEFEIRGDGAEHTTTGIVNVIDDKVLTVTPIVWS